MSGIEDEGLRPEKVTSPPVDEEANEHATHGETTDGRVDPERADAQIPEADESSD